MQMGSGFLLLAQRACVVNGVFYPAGARPALEMVVHQEAVGVDGEVTKWREPLTSKGRLGRFSESVGHNVSERRASLENASRGSRPAVRTGKAAAAGVAQPVLQWFHRGNGDGTRQGEEHAITRDPLRCSTDGLGIPTIRDRVVQMAFVLVVEPIFDEDLSGYFDTIPHHELMKCVARRISDRHLLHLVKMWLEAAVEETDEKGRTVRTTRNQDEGRGTPQGGVASPLLANRYMRRFVLGWKQGGHEQRLEARIVNHADDFVICCKPGRAGGISRRHRPGARFARSVKRSAI
jgi:hypothetical protein